MRCGCDLVHVARIGDLLRRRSDAATRLFSDLELADACRGGADPSSPVAHRRLAARWAAKEATVKALDRTELGPRDVEVRTRPSGAPEIWVQGEPADLAVSLSHDGDLAMAFVVARPSSTPPHDMEKPHAAR